jgi:hypothetical protein
MATNASIPDSAAAAVASPTLWERVTDFTSRHKTAVICTAVVAVAATAGGVWYLSEARSERDDTEDKRKAKSRKKKQKQSTPPVEGSQKATGILDSQRLLIKEDRKVTVEEETKPELPDVSQESVKNLSMEVFHPSWIIVDVRRGRSMHWRSRMRATRHIPLVTSKKQLISTQKPLYAILILYSIPTVPHVRPFRI